MITVQQNSSRTSKHNRDGPRDENKKNLHPSKNSRGEVGDNVRSAAGEHENSNRTQSKVLSFSIEAILNSPHPKRGYRNNAQNKHMQEYPQIPDQTRTALNTLEEFASTTLKDVSDERSKIPKIPTLTLEQKLAALQARLNQRKRRKPRTCFTNQQISELERRFMFQKYLSPSDRDELSIMLGLSGAQIITWFQNRRARFRRDVEELKSDVEASSIMAPKEIQKICKNLEF
ncbi:transcription factor LBX1-like [Actinia tenebrosa]|uniref:Transcription factor LBX1-like n=1 Tax=Actinia tenebrosa TaxID=6105 RepID=A0A6P8GZJ5_ACTTE|nr:transcription factor LBX1-like [Actinia tenebrosa]